MTRSSSSALEKALKIFDLFSEKKRFATVGEIASFLGQSRSSTYRYIETLKQLGFLSEGQPRGNYQLGLRFVELARLVRKNMSYLDLALPIMRRLAAETQETVVLTSLYQELWGIYVEQIESSHDLRISYERGKVVPLHAGASQKALLAHQGDEVVEKVINQVGLQQFTSNTYVDPKKLKKHLAEIRRLGYAISNEEANYGTRGVGAAVLDNNGKGILSLSVSGPAQRLSISYLESIAPLVVDAAKQLQKLLAREM